ncbi:MAG: hypothetical protein A2X84_01485 [Desulfuromonadaceae bacterium GWC2_58_13]|nr:MAG: hypothetical protein A2X84_01485 [Desulfuromonadaceae bacterium GWC2_58_13]
MRTEILVNLTILVGAALLFAGFLLLKLTEKELVTQRVSNAVDMAEVLARALAGDAESPEVMTGRAHSLLKPLSSQIESWILYDSDLQPAASFQLTSHDSPGDLARFRFVEEPVVVVDYASGWLPFNQEPAAGEVSVTLPLRDQRKFVGIFQARFSLGDIRLRVQSARQLVLLYVAMYGLTLVVFGLYLLGRNVVRPIRHLQELTQSVAGGNLEASLEVSGPREIADLTESFNRMISSLRQSREETRTHIISLQKVNDELIRSEKMASVGHLAAGMAHEIGNPLGAIVGYLELLKAELPEAGQRDLTDRSLVEAGRIDRLVRELLDFAAPTPCRGEAFDPVAVAAESLELLQNQGALEGRKVDCQLPGRLPCVEMVRHRLQQVLVNLLINARDATVDGDLICLAGGVDQGAPWLSVRDTGSGIAPEARVHLFDPFYTTKTSGRGRGLGLAICQRIIEEAGGSIEVSSEPGRGSEFRIWLKPMETE